MKLIKTRRLLNTFGSKLWVVNDSTFFIYLFYWLLEIDKNKSSIAIRVWALSFFLLFEGALFGTTEYFSNNIKYTDKNKQNRDDENEDFERINIVQWINLEQTQGHDSYINIENAPPNEIIKESHVSDHYFEVAFNENNDYSWKCNICR